MCVSGTRHLLETQHQKLKLVVFWIVQIWGVLLRRSHHLMSVGVRCCAAIAIPPSPFPSGHFA